ERALRAAHAAVQRIALGVHLAAVSLGEVLVTVRIARRAALEDAGPFDAEPGRRLIGHARVVTRAAVLDVLAGVLALIVAALPAPGGTIGRRAAAGDARPGVAGALAAGRARRAGAALNALVGRQVAREGALALGVAVLVVRAADRAYLGDVAIQPEGAGIVGP